MERPWLRHYDRGVPYTINYPEVALPWFLKQASQRYPLRPCTIYRDQRLSYAQVEAISTHLARWLRELGVHRGERIGLALPNSPQFVIAFFAVLKAGGIVVALNPAYRERELAYQIADAGIQTLIGVRALRETLVSLSEYTPLERWILTDDEDLRGLEIWSEPPEKGRALLRSEREMALSELLHAGFEGLPALPILGPDDVAVFQYSGGTTGTPKAAIGLHRNLVANTLQFRHWLVGMQEGNEVVLAAIPLFHVYGMVIAMSVGIALGASLVLIPDARDTDQVIHHIQAYRATLFPGVPWLYQAINRHPSVLARAVDLSSVKACISGSAPLLRETKQEFERLTGGKVMEGYGLSEAPTATHCNPMFGENRIGSIGLPLPDVDCRIVSLEDGITPCNIGEAGEMIIRGPQVMAGYYRRPEETAQALQSGWLYTGDIAYMDAEGYFHLVDRKKDLIKVGGFQVWPREVEEILAAYPGVKEVAVAGIPHPQKGEVVKAWVVPDPGIRLEVEDLKRWCLGHMIRYKVPEVIEFVQALPRTGVGKVLRRELVRMEIERARKDEKAGI
ncbi:long-chain fatty acid--CoA ligase [uncultured Thermanaerothrix sp.]|uniref:long-chain-fatty-acid--CoA ligase n=1 Tax=uncultured Thermanaerothrix sp. TaxID=1195149 RepID=UPI0026099B49|nr:long-chain fatty acid--CoA ligase [uncultured Thermanaerothrix sp.]